MPEALWQVQNPIDIPFRPLTAGMRPDLHPAKLESSMLWDASGVLVDPVGLVPSPGVIARFAQVAVSYPPVEGYEDYIDSSGSHRAIVFDTKFVYQASSSGLDGKYLVYSTGTVKTSGTFAVGSGTAWVTNKIRPGDVFVIGAGASLNVLQVYTINSETILTLASTPSKNFPAGSSYAIRMVFKVAYGERLDWTQCERRLIITDRARPPWMLSGSILANFSTSMASLDLAAGCVAYHADRLWLGDITIGSTRYPQRIMWSKTTSRSDFGSIGSSQFVDRPYSPGRLLRLVPLGAYLVAYFEDAVDIGRPTNIAGDSLPIAFQERLPTGGLGLLGPRAVCAWLDGHFFLAQNGAYYLSLSKGIERVDYGILEKPIRSCLYPGRAYVEYDRKNNRIVFGLTQSSDRIEVIYSFNLLTKAWSREPVDASCIAKDLPYLVTIEGLDSLSSTISGLDSVAVTIETLGIQGKDSSILLGSHDGKSYQVSRDSNLDTTGNLKQVLLETGDLDFDSTDKLKSAYRLSIRLDQPVASDAQITVLGSTNSGDSWRTLGVLRIEAGKREGFIGFSLTSSVLRFRLVSSSLPQSARIIEYTVRVRGRGVESYFTPQGG